MKIEDFKHVREWSKRFTDYTIEITHEKRDSIQGMRKHDNWWRLCVYLYPTHPLFTHLTSEGLALHETHVGDMPLHKGCSIARWHYVKGKDTPESKQIGCDYHHYQDDFYEEEDELERTGILADAAKLVHWLDDYAKENTKPVGGSADNQERSE